MYLRKTNWIYIFWKKTFIEKYFPKNVDRIKNCECKERQCGRNSTVWEIDLCKWINIYRRYNGKWEIIKNSIRWNYSCVKQASGYFLTHIRFLHSCYLRPEKRIPWARTILRFRCCSARFLYISSCAPMRLRRSTHVVCLIMYKSQTHTISLL